MNLNQIKLLKQLEQNFDSELEILYEGASEGFAYYFSRLDLKGIDSLLNDSRYYDGVSKVYYLKLIEKTFNRLKEIGLTSLKAFSGVCNGCIKGCKGFTFIDKNSGVYVDILIEVKDKEITNFMECYDLNNASTSLNKKERIVVKPYSKD